jgi:hypothetical protein
MTTTTTSVEAEVREFAAQFPTPNVLRAIALCESGRLTWAQVHPICVEALTKALG